MSGTRSALAGDELLAAARRRVEAVRAGLSDGPAPGELDVAVVVADLDVATFIIGVTDFALSLPDDQRDGWYRSFTRAVFLAGRPASASARHPYQHTTQSGDIAWYGPTRRGVLRPLSLLLRAFQGPAPIEAPAEPLAVTVPGPPTGHKVDVAIAVGGVSTGAYLVHAHHLIAEAVLRRLVRPGDSLRIDHRQVLTAGEFRDALDPARADSVQTRITHGGADSDRLRLYGVLTSDRPEGGH
ncbi:DUF6182 family protein [[Kitasatospora] papulosa]|uniref:DUF6182 family protein n=1 Tax=[Kitasatospora] papulosa TaxID=1464011 RepID=UPI00362B3E2D